MRWMVCGLALLPTSCATAPGPSTPLRIATWNMEHLAEANDSGCRPRTDADYTAMRQLADGINADVFAFQEVESVAAAARVFDASRYVIVIENRTGSGSLSECRGVPGRYLNRQATGFAVRRGLAFDRNADVTDIQVGNPDLRSSVDITLRPAGSAPLRLLSVHLKSGCASGLTNEACAELLRQAPIVERWIDARVSERAPFMVLGDFNRRLAIANDAVWADWDDNEPVGADLALAERDVHPTCDPRFRDFIDHMVTTAASLPHAQDFHEWTYAGERLSDHCPVTVDWQN